MDIDLIIDCLEKYSAGRESPPDMVPKKAVEEWHTQNVEGAVVDALLHAGMIEEYSISPNIKVRRMTYKGMLELSRLITERERKSITGKIRQCGWYVITAVASSVMTILTTWAMKKLGL